MPITLDGTNGITTPTYGGADTSEYLVPVTQFKNRIINGAMVIDQRNAGAVASLTNGGYALDRWKTTFTQASKYTVQQNAGSVTPPAGFTNYLGVTSSSAYSVTSSDLFFISQLIEGFNTADLNWGTANAKTVTLSFWVRSSLTGTFGGVLQNSAENYTYPYSYTISAANTWEYKTITIAGPTAGTWIGATNGIGMAVRFNLGIGSSFLGTANAWSASTLYGVTGETSVVGTNGATFYITGCQLEIGSTATSFDYRPYGTELALCQRYYYSYIVGNDKPFGTGFSYNTTRIFGSVLFPVTMRTAPTISAVSSSGYYGFYGNNTSYNFSAPFLYKADTTNYLFEGTITGGTTGVGGLFLSQNASASIAFSSEL